MTSRWWSESCFLLLILYLGARQSDWWIPAQRLSSSDEQLGLLTWWLFKHLLSSSKQSLVPIGLIHFMRMSHTLECLWYQVGDVCPWYKSSTCLGFYCVSFPSTLCRHSVREHDFWFPSTCRSSEASLNPCSVASNISKLAGESMTYSSFTLQTASTHETPDSRSCCCFLFFFFFKELWLNAGLIVPSVLDSLLDWLFLGLLTTSGFKRKMSSATLSALLNENGRC